MTPRRLPRQIARPRRRWSRALSDLALGLGCWARWALILGALRLLQASWSAAAALSVFCVAVVLGVAWLILVLDVVLGVAWLILVLERW